MKALSMDILRCPVCHTQLRLTKTHDSLPTDESILSCEHCNKSFINENKVIDFLSEEDTVCFSKRFAIFRTFYNKFYTPLTNLMFIPCGGVKKARQEVLGAIEMFPGASVLETGIGPGDNIRILNRLFPGCSFYGIDIQKRMLKKCSRNLCKSKLDISLYNATAERLPFNDHSFDIVFHLGAMNLFKDKKSAIQEMIRVVKPASKIVIADETQKAVRLFKIFVGNQPKVVPPVDLVPNEMQEIKLSTIWKGYGYLIEFRTPGV
ncbi:MAG TPA: methyltransferase domain-containing protein [Bacteroidales bacterium]|nr:methyltransferase domain-containing protein [Bacteroidales bacterium]HQI70829.1 methyltransferase domain-containing protein [Bacteroidales bacterium]